MKILILGSTGILGNTIKNFLKKKNYNLYFINRNKKTHSKNIRYLKNFRDFNKLEKILLEVNPNFIINCIGVTKFHKNYKNKFVTKEINTKLPIYIARYCLKKKIYFIHISTDCVFSGKRGNYTENSVKDAKDLYGYSKNLGEVKNEFTTTLRTSFIGPELKSNKSLLNWFLNQKNLDINGYVNAYFSGTTSLELAKILHLYFLKKRLFFNQIINVGGKKISKYRLLCLISKVFKKNNKIIKYQSFKIDRSLNSSKFRRLSKYKLKSWKKIIQELRRFMIDNKYDF